MSENGDRPELPEGWEWKRMGDIAECRLGKMLDKRKNVGEPRPYLQNINVQWGRFELDDVKEMRISDDEVERYGVRPGDLLVCEGGEPGRCAVWNSSETMFFQKALHRVRPHAGVSAEYLQHYLRYTALVGRLEPLITGTTIKHLPGVTLAQLGVAVPPLETQREIVRCLSALWQRLKAAEDDLSQAQVGVPRYRLASIRSVVPRASRVPLGSVVEVLDHKRIPLNRDERARRPGVVPYYGATGQVGTIDTHIFDEELVLLGEDGVPFLDPFKQKAYVIDGPSWVNNHAHVLRPVCARVRADYVKHVLDLADYRTLVGGTTRLKLNKSAMLKLTVPLPSLSDQDEVLSRISVVDQACSELRSELARTVLQGDLLRKGLLSRAMSGDLNTGVAVAAASEPSAP